MFYYQQNSSEGKGMQDVIEALEVIKLVIDDGDTTSLCTKSLGNAAGKGFRILLYFTFYTYIYAFSNTYGPIHVVTVF